MKDVQLQAFLTRLESNLATLREKEARLGLSAPVALENEISDHRTAIKLVEQALSGAIGSAELDGRLRPLLVDARKSGLEAPSVAELYQSSITVGGNVGPGAAVGPGASVTADIIAGGNVYIYQGGASPEQTAPRLRPEQLPAMVRIPAGPFWMGSEPGPAIPAYETPCSSIELPAYFIGKYPVTNKEYWVFVKDSGYEVVPATGWKGRKPLKSRYNHPVVEISWHDAQAYCHWLRQGTGRPYRLPSEAEWEKAARGAVDRRLYPWGDEWQAGRCNFSEVATETTAVDAFPPQITHGADGDLYDLVGNVREWTQTLWGGDMDEPDFPYPWAADARENPATAGDYSRAYFIYRGGAFNDERTQLRCSARDWYAPDVRNKTYGFRVALPLEAG
jgi:formylglycine-generating enzyme required for sulfatase activity